MNVSGRSPWIAVALVIAGMTAGYAFEVFHNGITVSAAYECPFKKACKDGGCTKEACAKGECKKGDCPGCAGMAES